MLNVRKQDPEFVGFVPCTAEEAVDRFMRCRRRGLKAYLVPECLISCAKGLPPLELEKFEKWIVNPHDDLDRMDLVETKDLTQSNNRIFAENMKRVEMEIDAAELPPLPPVSQEEEKFCDEKMSLISLAESLEPVPGTDSPSIQ